MYIEKYTHGFEADLLVFSIKKRWDLAYFNSRVDRTKSS